PGLRSTGFLEPEAHGMRSFLARAHTLGDQGARPLVFVGHSLGGALATLAYAFARYGACNSELPTRPEASTDRIVACTARGVAAGGVAIGVDAVATFGAPRAGDWIFGDLIAKGAIALEPGAPLALMRFVHAADLVAGLPTRDFG